MWLKTRSTRQLYRETKRAKLTSAFSHICSTRELSCAVPRAKRRNSISHFSKFYKIAYPHKQAHKSWMKVPNQCSQGVEQRARSSTPGEIQSHILWSVSPTYSLTIAQNSEQVEVNTRHDATPLLAPRPSRTS